MGLVQSTVRPLKGSKNLSGSKQELLHSLSVHSKNTPILVSAVVLRSRSLGQIDICCINKNYLLEIFEVKSSVQGCELSSSQRRRLNAALIFLTCILNVSGSIRVIK